MTGCFFTDQLQHNATQWAQPPMVIEGDRYISYGDVYTRALGIANALHQRGIGVGDKVAIVMPSSAAYLSLLWALVMSGCAFFPISLNRPPKDMTKVLQSMAFKLIIATPEVLPIRLASTLWFDAIDSTADTLSFTPTSLSDTNPVLCFQSSGSTGSAKTYIHCREQFEHTLRQYPKYFPWNSDDRLYLPMPLNDTVGCYDALAASLSRTTLVLTSDNVKANVLIDEIKRHHVTYFQAMPWQIRALLEHVARSEILNIRLLLGGRLFPHLKEIHVSTDYFSVEEKQAARKKLCKHVYEDYGCSEVWLIAKESRTSHHYLESVGQVVDGIHAEIVDDNDESLPVGEVGLIRFQADYLNDHYENNVDATNRHFKDGWFYSGDKAAINDEGYLFFYGRSDDLIAVNGAKYYPIDVERVLLAHKRIQELAWTTPEGEAFAIAVIKCSKALSKDVVLDYCLEQLPRYKVPDKVIVWDYLPKTRTGKIDKPAIKVRLNHKG